MMPFKSIRSRMTAAFTLSVAMLMLVSASVLTLYERHITESNAKTRLSSATEQVRLELADIKTQSDLQRFMQEEQAEMSAENLVLLIVDRNGKVIGKPAKSAPPWPITGDSGWRTTSIRFSEGTIVIGMPWEQTEDVMHLHLLALLAISLIAAASAAGGAWIVVGRTLSPIASLSRQANTASIESLRINLSEPSHDSEIVELVTTLNGLLTRLADTAAAKGRFYSSASHELRTPLQALSGHLEVALSKERTAEEYHAAVEEAYTQTKRLISLVQNLLLLNQLETANSSMQKEHICLADVCERALSYLQATIEERCLQIEMDLSPNVEVLAIPTHAEMLVRNLLENAVKYTDPSGSISINVSSLPDRTQLLISNECSELLPSNPEQLFEPFHRPDSSRRTSQGNGLGLAICKSITQANAWHISLVQDGSFVCTTVCFPIV